MLLDHTGRCVFADHTGARSKVRCDARWQCYGHDHGFAKFIIDLMSYARLGEVASSNALCPERDTSHILEVITINNVCAMCFIIVCQMNFIGCVSRRYRPADPSNLTE